MVDVQKVGFLRKYWYALVFVYIFGSILINIVDGGFIYYKTGNNQPLIDATIGKVTAVDTNIGHDVEVLKTSEDLDNKYVDYLKQDIIENFLILIIMWYLLYKLIDIFRSWVISKEQMNFGLKFLMGLFAFVLLLSFNLIYTAIVYDKWVVPLTGFWNLITNIDLVSQAVGLYKENLLINATLTNSSVVV